MLRDDTAAIRGFVIRLFEEMIRDIVACATLPLSQIGCRVAHYPTHGAALSENGYLSLTPE